MAADDASLEALGRYALRFVKPGHTLGLGTGRAASAFIRALGASGIEGQRGHYGCVRGIGRLGAGSGACRQQDEAGQS